MYGKLPMPVLMLAPEARGFYYITSFKSQLFSPYDSIPAVSCLQSAGCHPLSGLFFSCLQKDDIPEMRADRSAGKGCPEPVEGLSGRGVNVMSLSLLCSRGSCNRHKQQDILQTAL